jgi:3-methyladenine DNA glycosylase
VFNIVAANENEPQAVLIRAIEPVEDMEIMSKNRYKKNYHELTSYQRKNLSNGPGKLCNAMNIDKTLNGEDLCGDKIYVVESEEENFETVSSKRIGIDYAEEAKDFLWRFYIKDNKYVSKK